MVTSPFPAYSYRYFAGGVNTSAEVALGVVPAGKRFVINFISGTLSPTASSSLLVYLMPARIELTRLNATTGGQVILWSGRVVLHEGENAQLRAIGGNWVVSVHGYLLTGSGGPTFPSALPA